MKQAKQKRLRFFVFLLIAAAAALLYRLHTGSSSQGVPLPDTDAAVISWLKLHGWKASEPVRSETVMPEQWMTLQGQEWLRIQHTQGLHPESYAGKPVTRCVLTVENGNADCRAELWLCENELAGAEIYQAETQIIQPVY